jgi:hypothetical protein
VRLSRLPVLVQRSSQPLGLPDSSRCSLQAKRALETGASVKAIEGEIVPLDDWRYSPDLVDGEHVRLSVAPQAAVDLAERAQMTACERQVRLAVKRTG